MTSDGLQELQLQKTNSIKIQINQLIMTQSSQQENLTTCCIYTKHHQIWCQVNRHSINILMDATEATSHNINNLYNLTTSLATSVSFYQLIFHIRSVFANLCDSLNYILMVFCTYHGLYQCSHIRNTLSTHPTCHGSTKDVVTYIRYLTTYAAPTCFTR